MILALAYTAPHLKLEFAFAGQGDQCAPWLKAAPPGRGIAELQGLEQDEAPHGPSLHVKLHVPRFLLWEAPGSPPQDGTGMPEEGIRMALLSSRLPRVPYSRGPYS